MVRTNAMAAPTLDMLFNDDSEDNATPPARRALFPSTGVRHSIGVDSAKTAAHDPTLKGSTHIEALFGSQSPPTKALARFSLPTLLYSETDDPDMAAVASPSSADVKRKSLLEMIDADHPDSPSTGDSAVASPPQPCSPKRRRAAIGGAASTSPIARPSLIENQTAALARAAATDHLEGSSAYGSDTDTVTGEIEREFRPITLQPTTYPTIAGGVPRASFVAATNLNFEQQLADDLAAQQQQQAMMAAAQQQQAQAQAQAQQQAQQQQQLFAMQQAQAQQQAQQQQQLFAMQQAQSQQQFLPNGFPFAAPSSFPFAAPQLPQMAPPMPTPMPPQMAAPQMMMASPQMMMAVPSMPSYAFSPLYPPPAMPPAAAGPSSSTSPPPPAARGQPKQQVSPARSHHTASPARGGAAGAPAFKLGQGGNLLELATDKKGSRALQDGLPKMSDSQLLRACDELAPQLLPLAKHATANYVVSRLASLPLAHPYMIAALSGHVAELIVHPQGSRVVQAAIAELPLAAATELIGELRGRVRAVALDTHGSWGVCAAYKRCHAPFILADVVDNLEPLATQQHGCRVVQRVIAEAAASGNGVGRAAYVLLTSNVAALARDPYGNYAVQVTMRHATRAEQFALVEALMPQLLPLASSKHGSNVAEALLTLATPPQLAAARAAVFESRATLRELTGHPFGNYVLQAMLRLLAPDERAAAVRAIEADAADTTFGRTIVTHARA